MPRRCWPGSEAGESRHGGIALRGVTGLLALALVLAGIAPAGAATLHRWTDGNGTTHFTQEPPPPGVPSERLDVRSGGGDTPSAALRQRRCRDFRHALQQLRAVADVPADDPRLVAARERARRKIGQWCP